MDSKKTNLTPELKEIYDRVMNTSGTPVAKAVTPQAPAQPVTTATSTEPNPPDTGMTNPPLSPTQTLTPQAAPAVPEQQAPMPAQPSAPMPSMPSLEVPTMQEPTPAEQALSNTPARPVAEGNTFAFNGTAKNPTPPATTPTEVAKKKKAKISLPVIIVLGVVFILAWGIFWAIVLGLIQR